MPNTDPPITDGESLEKEKELANEKAKCDYALFIGATKDNYEEIVKTADANHLLGVKMYLNETFGYNKLGIPNPSDWINHFENIPKDLPICVHAEGQTTAAIILLADLYKRHVHICHVAREEEISIIKLAKKRGVNVTCEVSPHHLFLNENDLEKIGKSKATVKPPLLSEKDQKALWDNLDVIDIFASDHAPHLLEEKLQENSPPGFPGLETMLPLLLNAVHEGRLTLDDIVKRMYENPKRIFKLPDQEDTYLELDLDEEWIISEKSMFSKAKWTPFEGKKVRGKVRKVVLRNEVVFVDGKVLVSPGFGQDILSLFSESNELQTKKRQEQTINIYDMFKEVNFSDKHTVHPLTITPPTYLETQKLTQPSPAITSHKITLDIGLIGRHILSVDDFTHNQLHQLFNLAHKFKTCVQNKKNLELDNGMSIPIDEILRNKIMSLMFYEASTRTSCSFEAAMYRLGGKVITLNQETSSHKKGESLQDTINMMAGYSDVIILRHPEIDAIKKVVCRKPLINGGNGIGEHPTQALLDIFTIREEIGTVNGLIV